MYVRKHLWSLERIQKICLCTTLVCPIRVPQSSPTGKFLSKQLRPCSTYQVEAIAEAIVMIQTTPLRVPCVELSELTSSTPNRVTGRELVRGQRKKCLSTLFSSGIGWMSKSCLDCRPVLETNSLEFESFVPEMGPQFSKGYLFLLM